MMAEKKVNFKGMSPEKKREYIWDYYRFHILFGIIGLILVGTMVYEQVTKLTVAYNVVLLDQTIIDEKKHEALNVALTDLTLSDAKAREVANVTIYPLENIEASTDQMSRTYLQKLMIQLMANEVEVLLVQEADYAHFSSQDIFSELDLSTLCVDETNHIYNDANVLTGLKLSGSTPLTEAGLDTTDLILTVPATAKAPDQIDEVMNWLLCE